MKLRLIFLVLAILAAGCGGRTGIKTGTPGGTDLEAPAVVDVHAAVSEEDYKAALDLVGNSEVTRHNIDPYLSIAQYKYNQGQLGEAQSIYQKILLAAALPLQSAKAQCMVGQIYFDKKDYLPALSAFQNVMEKYPKPGYSNQSRKMMEFILTYSLEIGGLKKYADNYPDSPMNCLALFQLGSKEAGAGMKTEAADHLGRFIQQCPQNPSAQSAQLLLQSLTEQQEGKTWKIGLLAPLSGEYKGIGQSVKNGINLAMEQSGAAGSSRKSVSLVVKDTLGDAIQAVKVFQNLSQDDSLDAIIGPVRAREIEAVASLANQKRITLVSPSMTRDGLSSLGNYLFNNGITNEMQGRVIAKYAVEHLGVKRFGILAPADGYGETLSDSFKKQAESMGATITASETYPPGAADFKKQLLALGGQDPESAKENEKENKRRFDSLQYSMSKEIGKILMKTRELSGASAIAPTVALAPFAEGFGNTNCPSITEAVEKALQDTLEKQPGVVLRNQDLVKQALDRLPSEAKGTTLPITADQWTEVAQDIEASLIIYGRITLSDLPAGTQEEDHPTWDYSLAFEAFKLNSKKGTFSRIYQSTLTFRTFKDATLVRNAFDYQALYLPAHASEIPSLAAQIHFYDLTPVFLGGHTWESENVLQFGAKELEGSYFPTGFYVDSRQGTVKKFVDDYLKKYGYRPDLLAAQAYDSARLLLKAIDAASGRDDLPRKLMDIHDFDGVSGKTTFGGKGEAEKMIPILRIKNGKYEQVQ